MRLFIVIISSLAVWGIVTVAAPAAATGAAPNLKAISPSSGLTGRGDVRISMQLENADPRQTVFFWAVDNGEWNRIPTGQLDPSTATTTISVANWRWRQDNTYTLQMIALNYVNNSRVQKEVELTLSEAQLQQKSPAPVLPTTKLFVDPTGEVAQKAGQWAKSNPDTAKGMEYMAAQSMTPWFGGWNTNVERDVSDYVTRATEAQAMPAFVVYNIPHRDCGSYSAGGAESSSAYISWIRAIASGVGKRQAMIILEPDALAGNDCLDNLTKNERYSLLRQAVSILKTEHTRLYIDAGHANWKSPSTMANRLKLAGIDGADGFSLNVSNFTTTKSNEAFGTKLSQLVGDKHFVIDTSRNGNGPADNGDWCNPSGRALGQAPSLQSDNSLVDAYLWVKGPGGSDGTCGKDRGGSSAPSAGAWWPQYAEELVRNTVF